MKHRLAFFINVYPMVQPGGLGCPKTTTMAARTKVDLSDDPNAPTDVFK